MPTCQLEYTRSIEDFSWIGTLYELQGLPFGLCSALRVFTKLLKPVLAMFRHQGIQLIMYLNNLLVMALSKEELERISHPSWELGSANVLSRTKNDPLDCSLVLYTASVSLPPGWYE